MITLATWRLLSHRCSPYSPGVHIPQGQRQTNHPYLALATVAPGASGSSLLPTPKADAPALPGAGCSQVRQVITDPTWRPGPPSPRPTPTPEADFTVAVWRPGPSRHPGVRPRGSLTVTTWPPDHVTITFVGLHRTHPALGGARQDCPPGALGWFTGVTCRAQRQLRQVSHRPYLA